MSQGAKYHAMAFRFDPETRGRLEKASDALCCDMSTVVRYALQQLFSTMEGKDVAVAGAGKWRREGDGGKWDRNTNRVRRARRSEERNMTMTNETKTKAMRRRHGQVTVCLDDGTRARLNAACDTLCTDMSSILRLALQEHLAQIDGQDLPVEGGGRWRRENAQGGGKAVAP